MAKKDFGRRLMPEYLLKYSEELQKNHPDPSASWGGGGSDYTAGEGIDITGDVISIDEEVVAKKTDIPDVSDFVTDTDLNTALADYELKSEAFSGSYNDLTDKPTIPIVNDPTITFMQGTAIKGTIHLNQSENQAIVFDNGGVTTVDWDDITDKPTFATVATSGSYNDLSDKPVIPDTTNFVTTNTAQTVTGEKTFNDDIIIHDATPTYSSINYMDLKVEANRFILSGEATLPIGGTRTFQKNINLPFSTSSPSGTVTLATTDDIPTTNKRAFLGVSQESLGKVTFSTDGTHYFAGVAISDTDDPIKVNLIALNPNFGNGLNASYNSSTYALDVSIDTTTVALKTDIPTVPSVLSAFTNDVGYITGITRTDVTTALGYVPGTSNFSGDYEDLSGKPTIPDSTSDLVNDSGFISGVTSNMITTALGYTPGTSNFSGDYDDLTGKPSIPSTASSTSTVTPTTQTLIFTLEDDTNVTVDVMTGATVSTTTTLS